RPSDGSMPPFGLRISFSIRNDLKIPCACPLRLPEGFVARAWDDNSRIVPRTFRMELQAAPSLRSGWRFSHRIALAERSDYHFVVMPVEMEINQHTYVPVKAPRGTTISCKGWQQEAAMRMLMNNLDEEVAERPRELIVYGGTGKAARNWECFHAIVRSLKELAADETLLVQSGKPVGVFRTHEYAPRVLIANSNLVGHWNNWGKFNELDRAGLMMYGQMTAGSWIYIGSQGIVQGTFETFAAAGEKHFSGNLEGKLIVSGGMGGMGGAQPLAATMTGA